MDVLKGLLLTDSAILSSDSVTGVRRPAMYVKLYERGSSNGCIIVWIVTCSSVNFLGVKAVRVRRRTLI